MHLIVIFIIFVVPIWLILLLKRNHSFQRDIPMPESNFIFGHIFHFFNTTDILKKITNLTIRSGGIIRIYIPPSKPTIVVTNPKTIQEILRAEKALEKSNTYRFFWGWLEEGLLVSKVSLWKRNRKRITPCVNRLSILVSFMKIFDSNSNVLIKNLEGKLQNSNLDVLPIVKTFSMDVICETSMGVTNFDKNLKHTYFSSIINLGRITLNRVISPFKRYDFLFGLTKESKEYKQELKNIENVFNELMTKTIKTNNNSAAVESNNTFLDIMLRMENIHTTKYIREEVTTMLLGGHDTIATAISFILYELSRHPNIQDTVLAEQMEIFGTFDHDRELTYEELQHMKYLDLVINETLRMYPPIPTIARKVSEDFKIDGKYVIPKNHSLTIFIYGCHHNPKYFPEPEKFIPERFLNEIIPGSFIPFSMGPRNCIGKKFAMMEIKVCISKLIRHFRILRSDPDFKMQLVPLMVLYPKNGIKISLEKRVK